jgi:hypothetical protein
MSWHELNCRELIVAGTDLAADTPRVALYNFRVYRTENSASIVERVHKPLHSNGHGADNSEPIVACITQQRAATTHSSNVAWRLTEEMCLPLR